MRPPFYYPPNYTPMNYMPVQHMSPFFMRPNFPVPPMPTAVPPIPNLPIGPAAALSATALPQTAAQLPLTGFLANAQSLFNQAQQFTPYFQQAAPMLKNLPALWRMYRGFKGDDSDESTSTIPPAETKKSKQQHKPTPVITRPSTPKIYQPPYHF